MSSVARCVIVYAVVVAILLWVMATLLIIKRATIRTVVIGIMIVLQNVPAMIC